MLQRTTSRAKKLDKRSPRYNKCRGLFAAPVRRQSPVKMKLDKRYALQIVSTCCGLMVVDRTREIARVISIGTYLAEMVHSPGALQRAFKYAWERGTVDGNGITPTRLWLLAMRVRAARTEGSSESGAHAHDCGGEVAPPGGEGGETTGSGKSDEASKKEACQA